MKNYAHLHVCTEYSMGFACAKCEDLFAKAEEMGISALAIADVDHMDGVPEIVKAAKRHPAVKPIFGSNIRFEGFGENLSPGQAYRTVLLAKDLTGYRNLCHIVSDCYRASGDDGKPLVTRETLEKYSEGLICFSGSGGGELPLKILSGDYKGAETAARGYREIFGEDFYMEINRHRASTSGPDNEISFAQERYLAKALPLAKKLGIKVVAANDVRFVRSEDARLVGPIYEMVFGKKPGKITQTGEEYLKDAAQMEALFSDIPEAIANISEVVAKVRTFDILSRIALPLVPIPEEEGDAIRSALRNHADLEDAGAYDEDGLLRDDGDFIANGYLILLAFRGLGDRFGKKASVAAKERLENELRVILSKGLAKYFLFIHELITWARGEGFRVGPGRGNAPASLVCYCLGITNVDPLRHNLLFERFLHESSKNLPDIDIDIESNARPLLLRHFEDIYGEGHVGLIKVFGTGSSSSEEFSDPRLKKAIVRKAVHACSILVGKDSLDEYLPVARCRYTNTQDAYPISMYDSSFAGKCGPLQIDIIGLDALSSIEGCLSLIKERKGEDVDIDSIPEDDPLTYSLISEGETKGVFHISCSPKRALLPAFAPKGTRDLMAFEALYESERYWLLSTYADRRDGKEAVPVIGLPELDAVIKPTYGLFIYQEQLMEVAQSFGRFTKAESEEFRKAVHREDTEALFELYRTFFISSSLNGHTFEEIEKVWRTLTSIGKSLYSKSHSAAYARLTYQTAWLKAHYPEEFKETFPV